MSLKNRLVILVTLPISVIVTVGLTAFTLILYGPNSRAATLRSNFKDAHFPVCAHLLGHHVQGSFGGAVHRVVPKGSLRGLRADVDDGSWLLVRHHLANDQLGHVDHLLHIGVEQPDEDVGYSWA